MSIPFHLITGFLGSGKTAFLRNFLNHFPSEGRIAIIQNEFSTVNIDCRAFFSNDNYRVLEVNNGSAFCVCVLGSFIQSLAAFVEDVKPDLLVMEASGLSDPSSVGQIFLAPELKGKVYLEHVWCLVDAKNFNRLPALKTRMERQLRSADTIILNKIDLADELIVDVLKDIKQINPFSKILKTTYGKIDFAEIKKAKTFFPASTEISMPRPEMESILIRSNREIGIESFHRFLKFVGDDVVRIKGYVKIKLGDALFVQGIFAELELHNIPSFSGVSELVLIGAFRENENLQVVYDEYCRQDN